MNIHTAALKPPQSKRFANFKIHSPSRQRLDCGGFSAALFFAAMLLCSLAAEFTARSESESAGVATTSRTVRDFDHDWRFSKGDFASAAMPKFDDSPWRELDLPHDWSIEGPFGPDFGSGNGFAPGGIGWYRKHFRLDAAATNKLVTVEFDGVYNHAEIWINGHFIGGRPYGYSSFECELTPNLKFGGADNVIAVRVDHSRFADSRWYTGSGIYRHVRLRVTDKQRIAPWGVFVTTPEVNEKSATIRIATTLTSDSPMKKDLSVQSEVIAPDGKTIASLSTTDSVVADTNQIVIQQITVANPQLWSIDSPTLYSLRSRVSVGSNIVDEITTPFGIRTIQFDANKGFFLNEKNLKLKGVCVHHEAGCLGAAVPMKVWERRLRTLKELGVNAIRTSHNPPAPEFLDLCDRLGFLVKDEAFDEFTPAKNKWVSGRNDGEPSRFGYAEEFAEWSVRDISDMVRRDRNHPSIILWSIGNEIDYANDPFSHPVLGAEYHPENPPAENLPKLAKPLIAAVKSLDTTRPVTAALATVAMSDAVGLGEMLDAVGYNYQEPRYSADHAKYPKRIIFGSETGHTFSNWLAVRDNEYISGQFLWTGIDYLGEANRWPNHGSPPGLLDICGFKKPLAYFRQSLWSDQPMVYLCASGRASDSGRRGRMRDEESWNWQSNSTVTVHCYTTCDEVQLTLNGKVIGTKHRADLSQGELTWEIPFESGVLKAIGRVGEKSVSFELRTAGPAQRIELLPDVKEISADGADVSHVEFRVVDANGIRVSDASNEITFAVDGPVKWLGIENGDLFSPPDYQARKCKTFRGRGLAIVQSGRAAGKILITASSPGLDSASVTLNSK